MQHAQIKDTTLWIYKEEARLQPLFLITFYKVYLSLSLSLYVYN